MRKWNADLSAVACRARAERGMSMVEATIILMVLAILTAVVAPSIGDYIDDARATRAKEDVEAIGGAILRVVRDTGVSCLVVDTTLPGCDKDKRVEILYSEGNESGLASTATNFTVTAGLAVATTLNWYGAGVQTADLMDDQFITNAPSYTTVASNFTPSMNTASGIGWRGPYVSGPVARDPWGYKYQANTIFLSTANDATAGSNEGQLTGGWHRDVFVISAGPNGIIDTPIAGAGLINAPTQAGAIAVLDDVINVVQGTTR